MSDPVRTDYRAENNISTLKQGTMGAYRFVHWMCDMLANFLSDPMNIRDDRLCNVLFRSGPTLKIQVGPTYSKGVNYEGTTPAIIVGHSGTNYPSGETAVNTTNYGKLFEGSLPMAIEHRTKEIALTITIVTESCDGTLLLGGLVEDFLIRNSKIIPICNRMLSLFLVRGLGEIQQIPVTQQSNAKELYAIQLQVHGKGTLAWALDTQGPVLRAIEANVAVT
jgi:hypothetical protein